VATLLGAAVVATLVILALRSPTEFDPATPEGVAQRYVRALVDRDTRAAAALLDERLGCSSADFRHMWVAESMAARLVAAHVDDDSAEVDLVISQGTGEPFGSGWQFPVTLVMERRAGEWLISEVPWPIYVCEGAQA
jgi:hypothetical protein